MKKLLAGSFALCMVISMISCKKDEDNGPKLRFKFVFDSTQVRLNNLGQPATIPAGNAAQTPVFHKLSAHYIELAPTMYTALGTGTVLHKASEVNSANGQFTTAIDHDKCKQVGNGEEFFAMSLSDITPGTYEWLRVSLAYQNYDLKYAAEYQGNTFYASGTLASFIGYNTYINSYQINTQSINVNAPKLQGYWGFETTVAGFTTKIDGQAPSGAITVPNPLFNSSPIPSGSCVVTAAFTQPLVITGNETEDKVVTVSISIKQSFEWTEVVNDGWYQPDAGEFPVDMGVRGMVPSWQ